MSNILGLAPRTINGYTPPPPPVFFFSPANLAALSWTTTGGRWKRQADAWVICGADEPRTYYDATNTLTGVLLEGAGTVHSAPWHDPAAPNTSGNPAYLTKSQAGDTITYAGDHSTPDIFGGTGGGVLLTQGGTANGFFVATGVETALAASARVRVSALVTVVDPAGSGGQFSLRTSSGFAFNFTYDASGNFVSMDGQGNTATYRAGFERAPYTTDDGKAVWLLWAERVLAAATYEAACGFPGTMVTGRDIMLHDLRIEQNPTQPPSWVPVLDVNKTFAADQIDTETAQPFAAFIHGASRCYTRITDGILSLPASAYMSHDSYPLVSRVETAATTETVNRFGVMPNIREDQDFYPWGNPAVLDLVLAPGRHQFDIRTGSGIATLSSINVTSAFKNDVMKMAWVDGRIFTNNSLSGNITLDDVIIAPTTSTINDQFEQVDFSFSVLHDMNSFPGSAISMQRSLFMSHICTHSRARFQAQFDEDPVNGFAVWMGGPRLTQTNVAGMTLTIDDSSWQCIGRGPTISASGTSPNTRVHTWSARRVYTDRLWSDFSTASAGICTGTFQNVFMGRTTGDSNLSLYQSRKEIEVNIGAGWVPLSSSGLTENDLPIGQQARHIGVWDFATSTLDTGAATNETAIIRSWNRGSASVTDRPGFQAHLTTKNVIGAGGLQYERAWSIGDTFEIAQALPPSPTTPHVRFTVDLGSYSGSTFISTTNPALGATGTHADFFQPPATNGSCQDLTFDGIMILDGAAQGLFMQGSGPAGAATYSNITINNYVQATFTTNAISISQVAGTPTFSINNALVLPSYPTGRFVNGTTGGQALIRASGSNVTVNFTNVWYGRTAAPSPELGATFNGTVNLIEPPSITNFDTVVQATTTPRVGQMVPSQYLEPVTGHIDVRTINPLEDPDFQFTDYAESLTGMALNDLLDTVLATGRKFKPFVDFYLGDGFSTGWARDPDFIATISLTGASVGDKLDLRQFSRFTPEDELPVGATVSKAWLANYGTGGCDIFAFDNDGDLALAKIPTSARADRLYLLMTAANEMILVDVVT